MSRLPMAKTPPTRNATVKPAPASEKPSAQPATKSAKPVDPWSVLSYPNLTEKSTSLVEPKNTVVFHTRRSATKQSIQTAIEQAFNVKVQKVTTLITQTGEKKAYIRLDPKFKAIDITTRLGMV